VNDSVSQDVQVGQSIFQRRLNLSILVPVVPGVYSNHLQFWIHVLEHNLQPPFEKLWRSGEDIVGMAPHGTCVVFSLGLKEGMSPFPFLFAQLVQVS
jgi:hypothetical protein